MHHKIIVSFCILTSTILLGAEKDRNPQIQQSGLITSIDSEPSGVIDGCVNVISGEFVDHEIDLTIQGPEPLILQRALLNNNPHPKVRIRNPAPEWSFSHDGQLLQQDDEGRDEDKSYYTFEYNGPTGDFLFFRLKRESGTKTCQDNFYRKVLRLGFTNTSRGVIGGLTNVRNNTLKYNSKDKECNLTTSNGSELRFEKYRTKKNDQTGNRRVRYNLVSDKHPNRMKLNFEYHNDVVKRCVLKNWKGEGFAHYEVNYNPKTPSLVNVVSNDGRYVNYHFEDYKIKGEGTKKKREDRCLRKVERFDAPTIQYDYDSGKVHGTNRHPFYEWPKVTKKSYPDERYFEIQYYRPKSKFTNAYEIDQDDYNRVSEIYAPLGVDATPIRKFKIYYNFHNGPDKDGCAGVEDALGRKTNYVFDDRQRLTSLVKFNNGIPYSYENLVWGLRDQNDEINLQERTFGVIGKPITFCRKYFYTLEGDIWEDQLFGNLTGKGCDCLVKNYTYESNKFHLLKTSHVGRTSKQYIYIENSNLLKKCFHLADGKIYLRHYYEYENDTCLVTKHIVDDGTTTDMDFFADATERKIETIERTKDYPYGLPEKVIESYVDTSTGNEYITFYKVNKHNVYGRLIEQVTYDGSNTFISRETWDYDAHGNLIEHINPLGHKTTYAYDSNDNKIRGEGPNPFLKKAFEYDRMNRLIKMTEEHPENKKLIKHFTYDLCGNQETATDYFGHVTETKYDDFNRPIKISEPEILTLSGSFERPVTQYEYDELSNPIKITDPEGNVTQFEYTLYGKPYHISYPDGTEEFFEYDLEGNLIKEIAKNGTITNYTLDPLGRIRDKQVISSAGELLLETHSEYNALHLLSEKDPEGNITNYTYDIFGRKSQVTKGDLITTYNYDLLGRILEISNSETIQSYAYDALNQVTEEKITSANGQLISLINYEYDEEGRKKIIRKATDAGEVTTLNFFDSHGIPYLTIDANGARIRSRLITDFIDEYGKRVGCIETIDPLGQITLLIQDTHGRTRQIIKKNPFGEIIQKTTNIFNSQGKTLKITHTVFIPDGTTEEQNILWEYDSMHRQKTLVKAAGTPLEKRTSITYNALGQKEYLTKPDGVRLHYTYDDLGRVKEYNSSDNSFFYRYTYDKNSNPTEVLDLLQNKATTREYDYNGNVIQETQSNGFNTLLEYNLSGSLVKLTLPDQSSIQYDYEGPQLKTIRRLSPDNTLQYSHTYNHYDLSGNITESSMIYNLGIINKSYSSKGELKSTNSPFLTETLSYDPVGNLITKQYSDFQGAENNIFTYDPLYQMNSESGTFTHSYTYDSLYNRRSKDGSSLQINALNQLISDQDCSYDYDLNGNLKEIISPTMHHVFNYDALDRLISMDQNECHYAFTYDENNRCMTRQESLDDDSSTSENLIYVGQNEIGSTDELQQIKMLRVLGIGLGAEIGASIAIELNNQIYAPIHNHIGHIVGLINPQGILQESYRYSAFGEEKIYDQDGNEQSTTLIGNPWRYSSKRKEGDYINFGRRFYNPFQARWLTADPLGYEAGPNLYAFINNNALTTFDAYGLFQESTRDLWGSFHQSISSAWNYFTDITHSFRHSFRDRVRDFGRGISSVVNNVVPLPGLKDIGMIFGHYLEHGTTSNYTLSSSREVTGPHLAIDDPSAIYSDKVAHGYANGIMNTLSDALGTAHIVSDAYGGVQTTVLHGNTNGFIGDLIECAAQVFGLRTQAVTKCVEVIRQQIHDVGGVGNGGILKWDVHSQGGLIMNNALKYLTPEERKMMHVTTYGSGKLIDSKGLGSCTNYVSNMDFIPLLSDPIGYISARLGFRSDVKFFSAKSYMPEHSFEGAYKDVAFREAKEFKDRYIVGKY